MSRTYKDKHYKLKYPEHVGNYDRVPIEGYWYSWIQVPGVKTKKKKNLYTEWHFGSTPSWWTRMFMTRPRRNSEKRQLKELRNIRLDLDLEVNDFDFVDIRRKNHRYYW